MDHKRGHGSLDHSNEQFTRVKRHKDYSYQQPTHSNQIPRTQAGAAAGFNRYSEEGRERETRSASVQTRSSRVELASVEQLRAIAEKSAKSVNHLGRGTPPDDDADAHKTVEESAFAEFFPLLLDELSAEKLSAGSKWPFCLTDRRVEKRCIICPFDTRFRGWEALLIHAAKFQKEKTRQHRGYYRALREALLQSTDDQIPLPDIRQGPTSPLPKRRVSHGRWAPPVILVDDKDDEAAAEGEDGDNETVSQPPTKKGRDRAPAGGGASGRKKPLAIRPSRDPQLEEVLAVYSTGRNYQKKKVVVIPASQIGFIETGLLKNTSRLRTTEASDHNAISRFMEDRWPGAKMKKYVGRDKGGSQDSSSAASSTTTSTALCTTNSNRAMQLGRPSSPKDGLQRPLAQAEQEKMEGQELRLWKPLEEHRHIFDEQRFDDKVQTLVSKWKNGFKDSTIEKEDNSSLELTAADEKNLLQVKKAPKRKQVRRQITVLEDELRKDKLVWLQEVEAVREQFQALADSIHNEQVERDGATMRIEKHLDKRTDHMKGRIYDKRNFFMARKIQCMQNVRRIRREQDMQGLMNLWREEQRTFEKECQSAKKEKEKLIDLHDKIHWKAMQSKRKECPICLEKFDLKTPHRIVFCASRNCK